MIVRGLARALFIIAALLAIPFIIARALAGAQGENR